jgi:hypothetical protein
MKLLRRFAASTMLGLTMAFGAVQSAAAQTDVYICEDTGWRIISPDGDVYEVWECEYVGTIY